MLFDSHAHYNDERFKDDVDEVLSAMNENNVGLILNSCSSLDEVPDIFAICEKYPFVYASVGIHPHEVSELTEADMDKLKEYAKNPKVKAIGEIGLDYFYDFSPRDIQQKWFARQVDVARELKMPVVIHDREAHKDCMDILREHKVSEVGGVFHCYAGSVEMAKEILDWGMYIAFGGSLTFKKSVRPVEVAKYVPLDRIVIERSFYILNSVLLAYNYHITTESEESARGSADSKYHACKRHAEKGGTEYGQVCMWY